LIFTARYQRIRRPRPAAECSIGGCSRFALTTQLIRLLGGKAAGAAIPTDAVLAFVGFFALGTPLTVALLPVDHHVHLVLLHAERRGVARFRRMVIWFSFRACRSPGLAQGR